MYADGSHDIALFEILLSGGGTSVAVQATQESVMAMLLKTP